MHDYELERLYFADELDASPLHASCLAAGHVYITYHIASLLSFLAPYMRGQVRDDERRRITTVVSRTYFSRSLARQQHAMIRHRAQAPRK